MASQAPQPSQSLPKNELLVGGCSRYKCGYCRGDRLYALSYGNRINNRCDEVGQQSIPLNWRLNGNFGDDTGSLDSDEGGRLIIFPHSSEPRNVYSNNGAKGSINNNTNINNIAEKYPCNTNNDIIHRQYSDSSLKNSNKATSTTATPLSPLTKLTTFKSYSLHFNSLAPSDYQMLLNRGWRRSGNHLYLPKNWESCCPSIPIRLEVSRFVKNKGQKKVERVLKRALDSNDVDGSRHVAISRIASTVSPSSTISTTSNATKTGRKAEWLTESKRLKQHQEPQRPNTKQKMEQLQKCARQILINSTIIPQLQQKTLDIVKSVLLKINHGQDPPIVPFLDQTEVMQVDDGNNQRQKSQQTLQKWCAFKVSKCGKPKQYSRPSNSVPFNGVGNCSSPIHEPQTTSRSTTNEIYSIDATLSTSICATFQGRSQGKIDKSELGRQLVQNICMDPRFMPNQESSEGTVKIKSMEFHEKSGHVNVNVFVVIDAGNMAIVGQSLGTTPTIHQASSSKHSSNAQEKEPIENIIHNFINTYEKQYANSSQSSSSWTAPPSATNPVNDNHYDHPQHSYVNLVPPFRITVKSIPAHISARQPEVHRLYAQYQASVHGDSDPYVQRTTIKSTQPSFQNNNRGRDTSTTTGEGINGNHSNAVGNRNSLEENHSPFAFDNDDPNDSCDNSNIEAKMTRQDFDVLYGASYSMTQRDKIYKSYKEFYRFLVDSPFPYPNKRKTVDDIDDTNCTDNLFQMDTDGYDIHIPYGCYHQQYRINDTYLFAVGVVDILPNCLSSVYAFYDTSKGMSQLSLGKYTALREIEWVTRASVHRPSLKYYYLGYYIHSCQKMRYKAEYKPSELLCPVNSVWVNYEVAKKRIEDNSPIRHMCSLSSLSPDIATKMERGDDTTNIATTSPQPVVNDTRSVDGPPARTNISIPSPSIVQQKSIIDKISLDFGRRPGRLYFTNELSDKGRDIVEPVVSEFVKEIGEDISQRCIIKLY